MDWIVNLFTNNDSIAHIVLLYGIVISLGVLLGKVKIGGISLGVTFVLFAGIVAGHLGFTAPTNILTFIQDFGLILFVFMIGMQVGPGFFESFGTAGIKLNGLAAATILLNILVMFACYFIFFDTSVVTNLPMMVGTLYGAVTNTPGLGAANEALTTVFPNGAPQIASAYACAYPLGVLGIIGATILIRYICKVKLEKEEESLKAMEEGNTNKKPYKMHLEVTNKYLEGKTLLQVHNFLNRDFVVTRLVHDGELCIPNRDTIFHMGDQMLVVCAEPDHEAIMAFIGPKIDIDFEQSDQPLVSKRIVITNSSVNGETIGSMHFSSVHGVNVTRVTRHGMDLFASAGLPLQVGDRIMVVGPADAVERVANKMGNSAHRLNAPNIATIFVGIFLGLIFGMFPLAIPGMPVPVKLGLAGGPLIIAILIGR
jgi:putative transport protein